MEQGPRDFLGDLLQLANLEVRLESPDVSWDEAIRTLHSNLDASQAPAVRRQITLNVTTDWGKTPPGSPRDEGDWLGRRFLPQGRDRYESNAHFWHASLRGFDEGEEMEARFTLLEELVDPPHVIRILRGMLASVASPALVHEQGLLVHGCAMAHPSGDHAALFLGESGAGKSTMTRRLPGWTPLADDTVFVDLSGSRAAVSGTLLPGKEHLPRSATAYPLAQVYSLVPGSPELSCPTLVPAEAFVMWMERLLWYLPQGPLVERALRLVERLAQEVPAYRLESSLSHDVGRAFVGTP